MGGEGLLWIMLLNGRAPAKDALDELGLGKHGGGLNGEGLNEANERDVREGTCDDIGAPTFSSNEPEDARITGAAAA